LVAFADRLRTAAIAFNFSRQAFSSATLQLI
jgi:hypothetical protein